MSRGAPRWWAIAAGVLAAVGIAVFTRALGTLTNYDESVYLASLDALRRGQELGGEVYTSQPPVFYWLLRAVAAPFGSSIEGIRLGFALVGLGGVLAAVALGWRLYAPAAGVLAGALLVAGPPYPANAPVVAADVPSVALGLLALALLAFALGATGTRRDALAACAGAVLLAAVGTKLLAVPFAVPFLVLALLDRSRARLLACAALGAAALLALVFGVHASSLGSIWSDVVSDHTGASELGGYGENLRALRDHLHPRTPIAYLAPVGLVALLLSREARRAWPLWTLVPASLCFLFLVRPLADHHMVLLSAALAVSAGPSLALAVSAVRAPWVRIGAIGAIALLVAAGAYQEQRRLHRNDVGERPELRWAVATLERTTRPDDVVVTDRQVISFLAHRATPGQLVDTSNTRIAGGGITDLELARLIEQARPAAVVTDREFRELPRLLARIRRLLPVRYTCGETTVYLRRASSAVPPCPVPPGS